MLMERDSRKSKAYAAERRAFRGAGAYPLLPLAEMDQFCRKVLASKRVQTAYELPANLSKRIEIRTQRGGGAQAWMRVIQFGTESCRKWIALHELAHVIQSYENHTANVFRRHGGEPEAWDAAHGHRWAKIYLDLVRREMPAACRARWTKNGGGTGTWYRTSTRSESRKGRGRSERGMAT